MTPLQCNCNFLRSAGRALTQAYDEVLRPVGLRTTQFTILARTAATGALPVSELADMLAMDRTTLSRNVQVLERDGLIDIKAGENDRRERHIHLTTAGRNIMARAMPLWDDIHQRFEEKFGVKRAKLLRDTMRFIIETGRELSKENAES